MELVQLLISGISQGCVYGLIALGFVLIYKATEMVNFAQGDLMMLGAFIAFGFINVLGWPFLWGFLATLAVMGVVGVTLERLLLRPMIGEPPFAVLMLTIGLGFILRAVAGAIWGYEDKTLSTPYGGGVARWGEISVGYENIAVVLGTLALCVLVFVFFRKTRVGIAMQAASQNQLAAYYVGIPVKWIFALVWAMSAMISATAGILVDPADGQAWTNAIVNVVNSEQTRGRLRAAGLRRAAEFTWARTAKLTLDAYRRVLERPP